MQQKYIVIVVLVVVGIIGVGYMVVPQQSSPNEDRIVVQDIAVEETESEESTEPDSIESELIENETEETPTQAVAGVYTQYSADAVAASAAEHIVLVFSASWCPTCRALDKDIVANEEAIPAGVELYTVDFDTATELRRTYGVTVQHTLVEIDNTGDEIQKWTGGTTLTSVLAKL